VARRSKASPDIVEQVETALARGATIAMAAHAVGVSPRTVGNWISRGVVTRRYLRPVPSIEAEMGMPDGGEFTDENVELAMVTAVLRAAPVDWRAARFILERRWPERWGSR
jgi:transposase